MRLYLIRHAQSANNALYESTGSDKGRSHDPTITEIGFKQSDRVADWLANELDMPSLSAEPFGITHLFCSPMLRAMQTAKPIGEALDLPVNVWVDVHETGGIFLADEDGKINGMGGMTRAEMEDQFAGYVLPDNVTDAGWWKIETGREPYADRMSRATRVALQIHDFRRGHPSGRMAIVMHGAFIDLTIKALLHQLPMPQEQLFYLHYNTAITRIDFDGDGGYDTDRLRIHYMNRVDHLPTDMRTW